MKSYEKCRINVLGDGLLRLVRLNTVLLETLAVVLLWLAPMSPGRAAPTLPTIPPGVFCITNYGAVGDGIVTNTAAIQATLDAANAAGGGTVEVPAPGTFLSGPLAMHARTRFQIDAGATLRLLPYHQYPGTNIYTQTTAFIELDRYGSDFEFCGPGLLDGQGQPWWTASLDESARPYELHMRDVSRVYLHDWNSTNPPMKHIVMDGDNYDITVRNATNSSPDMSPSQNTDCLNLLGTHCLVQDCAFRGCDDNIAMGRSSGACIDILITNITCGTGHGISFGSLLPAGGVSNVTVINCTFSGTENGIRFKADNDKAHGQPVQAVRFLNIGMTNVTHPIIIYSYYNWYGSPDNITPAIAASTNAALVTSATPIWRDILISNVWGTASSGCKEAGIIWGRTEMLVSNVMLRNINLTAPATFNVYNARAVQFVDCKFTPSSGSFPTYTAYNADLTITNSTFPGLRPVTLDGMTTTANQSSNTFYLFNTLDGLTKTNVLSSQPRLTIGSSLLQITNHLNLTASSVLNFFLGTNAATIGVRNNLALAGTINVADGGGLTNASYILFTNGGTFTWNNPVVGTKPDGSTCTLDTATAGQVKLVVTVPTQLAITNQPQSLTNAVGATATFSVGATGVPAPGYQWRFNNTDIAGAAAFSLSLTNIQLTNAGGYTVVVTNASGAVTSDVAVLTVLAPPAILGQEFLDGSFRLSFIGPDGQTYQILTSTNPALAMESWTVLTNGTFPASGPFIHTPAANDWIRFYRVVSP